MKLLLTSAGIKNKSIADALGDLTNKDPSEVKIGFITTAVNVEAGNKDWYIRQFMNLYKYGYSWIDVIDPSAPDVDWKTRLTEVDVIFVSGGNTFHLLNQYRKTGFGEWVIANLESKVYVGVSAGTIIMTPTLEVCTIEPGDPNLPGLIDISGMNVVEYEIEPHCDEERFTVIKNYAKDKSLPVYAIDDQTAIKVVGATTEVVSEGKWQVHNKA